MSTPSRRPGYLPLALLIVGGILGLTALGLSRGGLVISQHEGDLLHLVQILMLMQDGAVPHVDFRTPIGILAFLPLDLALNAGWGIGQGFILAQGAVALALAPAIWWVAISRFVGWAQAAVGGVAVIWLLALVHGGTDAGISVSMHYNRWSWTVAMLAILTACLPRRAALPAAPTGAALADALLIGLGFALLGLTKATFAVAFAPAVVLALILRGQGRVLAGAVLSGVALCLAVALVRGGAFWPAYLGDLLWVATSPVRPFPGQPLSAVIASPAFLPGTLLLLAAVIMMRRGAPGWRALPLLLLAPAFVYVTYQNFGNDPKWLVILALLFVHLLQQGAPGSVRGSAAMLALVAGALATGSLFNMARSIVGNALGGPADAVPLFAADHPGRDLLSDPRRLATLDLIFAGEEAPEGLSPLTALPQESGGQAVIRPNTTVFLGETLPNCGLDKGLIAHQRALSRNAALAIDTAAQGGATPSGPAGRRIFVADLFSGLWIFGGSDPVQPLAPWNYGALTGIATADYLLVPLCPVNPPLRKHLLEALEKQVAEGRLTLTPLAVADTYAAQSGLRLYSVSHP